MNVVQLVELGVVGSNPTIHIVNIYRGEIMEKPNIASVHLTKHDKQIIVKTDHHTILVTPDERVFVNGREIVDTSIEK